MIYYTSHVFSSPPCSLSVPFPHEPQPCSHSRLSSVSVNTDIGHRAWHSLLPSGLFSALASAPSSLCLVCSRVIAEWPKVTLRKTESAFCLSALPPCAVRHAILAVKWFLFLSILLHVSTDTFRKSLEFLHWETVVHVLNMTLTGLTYLFKFKEGA